MTTDRASGSASQVARVVGGVAMLTAIPCLLLICGCGGAGDRESIAGTVTIDGKPLEKGQIAFIPQTNTEGPTAGGEIVGGEFAIPATRGTFAGKFRVEITASRPSGKKVIDRLTREPVDSFEQFIPRKYNIESELDADVKAGDDNRFEFALNSK